MGMGYGDDLNAAETAFLDEVPSPAPSASGPAATNSPLQATNNIARTASAAAAGRKRKSDAIGDLEGALGAARVTDMRPTDGATSSKVKRRKD